MYHADAQLIAFMPANMPEISHFSPLLSSETLYIPSIMVTLALYTCIQVVHPIHPTLFLVPYTAKCKAGLKKQILLNMKSRDPT